MERVYLAGREDASVKAANRSPYCLTAAALPRKGRFLCTAAALPHDKHAMLPWTQLSFGKAGMETGNPFLALVMGLCNMFPKAAIILVKILSLTHQELSPPPVPGSSALCPSHLSSSPTETHAARGDTARKAGGKLEAPSPTAKRGAHPRPVIVPGSFPGGQRGTGPPGRCRDPRAAPAPPLPLLPPGAGAAHGVFTVNPPAHAFVAHHSSRRGAEGEI